MLFAVIAALLAAPAAPPGKNALTPPEVFARAELMVTASNFDGAEKLIRQGLESHPNAPGFHLALGKVHAARGHQANAYYEFHYEVLRTGPEGLGLEAAKAAKQLLENARGFEVDEARTYIRAANAVEQDPAGVRKTLEKIAKERGSRFTLRFFIAEAKLRGREFEPALAELRALTKEDPGFVPAIVLEAMALRALGRQSEAVATAKRARDLSPNHWSLEPLALLEKPLPPIPPLTPVPSPPPASPAQ